MTSSAPGLSGQQALEGGRIVPFRLLPDPHPAQMGAEGGGQGQDGVLQAGAAEAGSVQVGWGHPEDWMQNRSLLCLHAWLSPPRTAWLREEWAAVWTPVPQFSLVLLEGF